MALILVAGAILALEGLDIWQRQERERARANLHTAWFRMASVETPVQALKLAMREIVADFVQRYPKGRHFSIDEIAPMLVRVFGPGVRVTGFDGRGKAVWPALSADEREPWEIIWKGILLALRRESGCPLNEAEARFLEGPATREVRKRFGQSITPGLLEMSTDFQNNYPGPDGYPVHLAVQIRLVATESYLQGSGFILEVPENRLPPAFFRLILQRQVTAEVDRVSLADGTGALVPFRSRLTELLAPPVSGPLEERRDEGFGTGWETRRVTHPLGPDLVLGKRLGWVGGLDLGRLRRQTLVLILLVWLGGLAGIGWWAGRGEGAPALRWQIAATFALAGCVPLLGLGLAGFRQAVQADEAAAQRWRERARQSAADLGDRYVDYLNGLQIQAWRKAQDLGRRWAKGLEPDDLIDMAPWRLGLADPGSGARRSPDAPFPNFAFVYGRDGSVHFPRRGIMADARRTEMIRKALPLFGRDLLDDLLAGKGAPPRSDKLRLSATDMDFLGADNFLMTLPKNLGRVTMLARAGRPLLMACQPLETSAGEVVGVLFQSFSSQWHNKAFIQGWGRVENPRLDPVQVVGFKGSHLVIGGRRTAYFPPLAQVYNQFSGTGRAGEATFLLGSEPVLLAVRPTPLMVDYLPAALVPERILSGHSRRILASTLWAALAGVVALAGLAYLLYRRLVRPLEGLVSATNRLQGGDFQVTVPVTSGDEFGRLAAAFNAMAQGLRERERLRRFVSERLWQEASQHAAAGRREMVAVLFADLRGFTTLSERYPAEQVVQLLNDYFSAMELVIRSEGGEIDKFIGDALQAVFRPRSAAPAGTETRPAAASAPVRAALPGVAAEAVPAAVARAVRAGLAMRAELGRLNGLRREVGAFPIDNGVGITVGEVLCGRIGPAQGRSDFSVMGPAVGEAMALEARSKAGRHSRVIVSAEVHGILAGVVAMVPLEDGQEPAAWEIESMSHWESAT